MEAIKKQAARLREQVAKQQQAVLKHLGHISNDGIIVDEAELQCYKHLQNLYSSTRAAKHFQKNIVRGIDGFVTISSKQMEILRKLADECCKYGAENQNENNYVARAVLQFGASHNFMESERETLLGVLDNQVSKPLRALITGAPLEDARHLTHRYDKLRQEVESQAAEVVRRRSKTKDSEISAESCMKLRGAEARLTELKSTMMALGREATAAMSEVENQQQQITVERLFNMVDAERCYHQHVLTTLDKLLAEMILEEQLLESSSQSVATQIDGTVPPVYKNNTSNGLAQRDVKVPPVHFNNTSNGSAQRDVTVPPVHENNTSNGSAQRDVTVPPVHENNTSNGSAQRDVIVPPALENNSSNGSTDSVHIDVKDGLFIAKVIHPFDAQAEGELSLSVDDYVVVRQVAPTGWSEGEFKGKAGWFPSAYVEKQEKAPASKIVEASMSP